MKRSWRVSVVVLVFAVVAAACTSGGGNDENNGNGTGSSGPIKLTMWVGYTPPPPENQSFEYLSIDRMVKAFEAENPGITIELQYVNSDNALQKATVAIQGNQQPDISYQYGTNMAQLAQSPKIVDLTDRVKERGLQLERLLPRRAGGRDRRRPRARRPGARRQPRRRLQQGPVQEGRHPRTHRRLDLGRPARPPRRRSPTPANKVFGLVFPVDGSETTVWEYEAMLWAAGGEILNSDNTQAAFNSAGGRPRAHDAHRHQPGRLDLPGLPARLRQVRGSCSTPATSG